PWIGYATPLEMMGTHKTVIHEGVVPTTVNIKDVIDELEQIGGIVVKLINADKDLNYLALICLRSKEEEILALLKQRGFSEVYFRGMTGTVAANIERIENEKAE